MHAYILTAVCRATVTETWKLTSPTPLDWAALSEIISDDDSVGLPDGATLNCIAEVVSNEEDRELVNVVEGDDENEEAR